MFDKFAEDLKQARGNKGLTLQQVSLKTKIDYRFLEMMEDGDFSFLPELYVRAFLKNYARVVGLEEEYIISRYDLAKAGKLFQEPEAKENESEKTESKPKNLTQRAEKNIPPVVVPNTGGGYADGMRKYLIAGGAFTIILIVILFYIFSDSRQDIIVTEKPLDEIVEENRQRYIEEDNNNNASMIRGDSLNLNIVSSETSWVKISYDNRTTDEFILFPMSQKNVKAAGSFRITFGNFRGIKLRLNGSELSIEPNKRTVAHVLIDSAGLHYLNSQPNPRP